MRFISSGLSCTTKASVSVPRTSSSPLVLTALFTSASLNIMLRLSWSKAFEESHGKLGAFIRNHRQDFKLNNGTVFLKKRKPTADADGWTQIGSPKPNADAKTATTSPKGNQYSGKGDAARNDKHLQDQWGVYVLFLVQLKWPKVQ